MTNVFKHLKIIKYKDEKQRLVFFGIGLILILILSSYLFSVAYSRYEIRSRVLANIDKALYIFGADNIDFNLEPMGIIPSNTPHVYKFTVSNYNDKHDSDVDLKYRISIRTTTNLPISVGLYRNEEYNNATSRNILPAASIVQDEDGAWYRNFVVDEWYEMQYKKKVTDTYTLVIYFPEKYKEDMTYADYLESIEIILESQQIV